MRWQRNYLWRKRNCLLINESGTKEENNEMFGLECSTVCNRDVDVDAYRRRRLEAFEMWIWRRMGKISFSWLDKVTNEEVLGKVNENRQRKHQWIGHVLRHDGLLYEITEGRMKGKPTRGRREKIQVLHDLANDGQLRTERDGDTEKGCQKLAVQQRTDDDDDDDDDDP